MPQIIAPLIAMIRESGPGKKIETDNGPAKIRATISFPPDMYETLEATARASTD